MYAAPLTVYHSRESSVPIDHDTCISRLYPDSDGLALRFSNASGMIAYDGLPFLGVSTKKTKYPVKYHDLGCVDCEGFGSIENVQMRTMYMVLGLSARQISVGLKS
jgi:hypothetical protein